MEFKNNEQIRKLLQEAISENPDAILICVIKNGESKMASVGWKDLATLVYMKEMICDYVSLVRHKKDPIRVNEKKAEEEILIENTQRPH
jgi:hypothetical protein